MSYNLLIEDLNISLITQSNIINKYYNDIININSKIISIQDNINTILSNPLDKLISKLLTDISSLPQPVYNFALDLPDIYFDPSSNNSIIQIIQRSKNTVFNTNKLILQNDFTLKFNDMDKLFRVKYNNNNVSNLVVYIYGFQDEIIDVIETNIQNISHYIANIYNYDVSLNKNDDLDIVNLIIKEEENYKLLVIDGRNMRILSSVNINILGDNPYDHPIGTPYIDPGFTATDNLGRIVNVITTNNVDINNIGTYNVIYTATDLSGNDVQQKRIVNVI